MYVVGSFKHPKHMLKLIGKKIFRIYAENVCLSKPIKYDSDQNLDLQPCWIHQHVSLLDAFADKQ